jgi:hypothetical protein
VHELDFVEKVVEGTFKIFHLGLVILGGSYFFFACLGKSLLIELQKSFGNLCSVNLLESMFWTAFISCMNLYCLITL